MKEWNFYTSKELKAKGWLRRQLEIQAEGLNGNLDRVWPDVQNSAWIGGDREGWERVPYWLDGFIPLAYLLEDVEMIGRAKKYIDAIVSAQQEDGWVCPCDREQRKDYDTWAVLLIAKVLTVYCQCSGDERIPEVLYRVLKNYYELLRSGEIHLFGWGKFRWYEGMIAIEFVNSLYKEEWLLDLAALLRAQGANYEEFTELWKRPLNRWRLETHIVNLAMMLKYEAVSCDLLGENYTDAAERLHEILDRYNGTPVGTFTGDECLSGLSPIQGTELCAVVEQMYSYELLYAYTGDEKWARRLESVAFNALPATVSDDMWAHQYVQMSNQIACRKFPGKSLFRTNGSEAHLFGLEPNYGCCTANFGQGWPKLALSAFMYRDNTIINGIPVPSELQTGDVHIVLKTDYPFENRFTYIVEAKRDFTFVIRIPAFAENLTVNGTAREKSGTLCFEIGAGAHEQIELRYDAVVRMCQRPYDLQSVVWGPLVFSLPIEYEKVKREYEKDGVKREFPYCDYEYIPLSDWNYAYCAGEPMAREFRGVGSIPFSSDHPPVVIRTRARRIHWGLEDGYETVCAKTPCDATPVSAPEEVVLYPYGCAKLRMTELPLVGNSDESSCGKPTGSAGD